MVSERAKDVFANSLATILGRRRFARLARFLWTRSRLDIAADIHSNGERRLQRMFAESVAESAGRSVVLFDVGANVGDWTASLLELLSLARVPMGDVDLHLFEPAPTPRAVLDERFTASGCSVAICNCVLADEKGTASFSIFSESDGMNTLKPLSRTPTRTIDVEQITVDDYCAEHGVTRIDFMKVDTEGNDLRVLRGAQSALADGRIGLVQFEYNHLWVAFRSFLKDVFDLVEPLGYRVGKVTPHGIERYRGWHHELESFRWGNYVLWRDPLPGSFVSFPWWND